MSALSQILSGKSDKELMFYINNVDKHTEEAVWTALEILNIRNVELPKDVTETIKNQLDKKKEKPGKNFWDINITTDLDAPELYSQKSIYVFSILFSVLFGSVMLAYNLYKVKKPFIWAILFGLIYSSGTVYVLEEYDGRLPMTFIVGALGAVVLYQLFWNRWIGSQTKYRAKPVWVPLIVALLIFIPIIIMIFNGY
jgi:hypothetical protein